MEKTEITHNIYVPVSVVIPCYNCADTLKRAVASVAAQTSFPSEVIIVNDGSCDDGKTREILSEIKTKYAKLFKIKIIELPENLGPSKARNIGWETAVETYVAFLDADDAWHPEKIRKQYGWMAAHTKVAFTGHPVICMREYDLPVSPPISLIANRIGKMSMLLSNPFSTPSVMLQRTIPFRFEITQKYAEDQLLWYQIILSDYQAYILNDPMAFLYKARYGGQKGLSSSLWKMEKAELNNYHRVWREGYINTVMAIFFVAYSLFKYVRRVLIPRRT